MFLIFFDVTKIYYPKKNKYQNRSNHSNNNFDSIITKNIYHLTLSYLLNRGRRLCGGWKNPFLFFELKVSYCFNPNTYEFKEELIDWDYKGFRLGFE